MATLSPCTPSQLTAYVTPWGLRVTVNRAILERFRRACEDAYRRDKRRRRFGFKGWKPRRIDSYNCRTIRGSSAYSRHAYGAAWDFFDRPYPEPVDVWGDGNSPPRWFARAFTKRGFTWGAVWTRQDFPHIEWSSNVA